MALLSKATYNFTSCNVTINHLCKVHANLHFLNLDTDHDILVIGTSVKPCIGAISIYGSRINRKWSGLSLYFATACAIVVELMWRCGLYVVVALSIASIASHVECRLLL